MFCNIRERLGCSDTKPTRRHCMCTQTDWAADELTRKSVSCTVERYGSHMIDCSVAKQSLVALFSGEAEFYGIVRAVATSKQTSQILEQIGMQSEVTIASDSSAGMRNMHQDRIREGATSFNHRVVDTRIVSKENVPVGVGRHVAERDRCHYALEKGKSRRWHVQSSPIRTPGEATEGMEKIATHASIQKNVMDATVKKIATGVSNQRMTNTVGNHCATKIVN